MKTEEDEAFEDIERRQGGFQAKRQMAADKLQEPAQEPSYWLGYGLQAHTEKPFDDATPLYTTPPQRQPLTDIQLADCIPDGYEIIERNGERNLVAMTRAQLHEFVKAAVNIGAKP